jgi:ADP-ribose pyrophosphatase YjhB (NUDIX family)
VTAAPLHPVDVFLLLTRADDVLLGLRTNTGYADGQWNLPSGKLEDGEDVISAVIREAREEVGIRVRPEKLRLVAVIHHRSSPTHARIGLAFASAFEPDQHGEPTNAEPQKCAGIEWFPTTALPPNTTPFTAACVRAFLDGQPLRLSGWPLSFGETQARDLP